MDPWYDSAGYLNGEWDEEQNISNLNSKKFMEYTKINLKATLDKAGKPYTRAFLRDALGKSWQTIDNWYKGGGIPSTSHSKLIHLLERNEVEIIYN